MPEPLGDPEIQTQPPGRAPMPSWIPKLLIYSLLAIGIGIALYHVIGKLSDLIAMVLSALFVSFALEPAVNWLAAHGWRRGLATFAILLGLAVVMIAFVASFVPLFLDQLRALVAALPSWLNRLNVYTERWFNIDISTANVRDQLRHFDSTLATYAKNVAGNLFGIVTGVLGMVFRLLAIALFSFYMIADGPRLRRAVCSLLPAKRQEEVLRTWEIGIEKTGGYVLSRLLLAGISAGTAFIVLLALGVPFPFALALWIGVISQFVPTVGTYIAATVPLVVTLFEKGAFAAIVLLIYILAYQQLENYVLSPRVTAHTMELHPAVAFGSVIAGATLFGATGALLALPAAATIQGTLSGYVRRHEVIESDLTARQPLPTRAPPQGSFRERLVRRFRAAGDRSAG